MFLVRSSLRDGKRGTSVRRRPVRIIRLLLRRLQLLLIHLGDEVRKAARLAAGADRRAGIRNARRGPARLVDRPRLVGPAVVGRRVLLLVTEALGDAVALALGLARAD